MCLPYLQASQAPAVRESTSPDRERRRKTPHRDRQCTDNNEGRSTPLVAQQNTCAVAEARMAEAESAVVGMAEAGSADVGMAEAESADVGMAEAGSADVGMAEAGSADVGMAEAESADVGMAEAESADANMSPEK